MRLDQITFPVFVIGRKEPITENGVTYLLFSQEHDDAAPTDFKVIIDDKNVPKSTLALRRLHIANMGVEKLYKIKKAIYYIADLLKIASKSVWFIDSLGTVFKYKKTRTVKLVYEKIHKVLSGTNGGYIIELENSSSRFKVLYAPRLEERYAGILKLNPGQVLYGLYDKQYKSTSRRI